MSNEEQLLILKAAADLALEATRQCRGSPEHIAMVVKAGVKALLKARRQLIAAS